MHHYNILSADLKAMVHAHTEKSFDDMLHCVMTNLRNLPRRNGKIESDLQKFVKMKDIHASRMIKLHMGEIARLGSIVSEVSSSAILVFFKQRNTRNKQLQRITNHISERFASKIKASCE